MISKLDLQNKKQINFLVKYLREFYTRDILNWQYQRFNGETNLYLMHEADEYYASQGMIPYECYYRGSVKSAKSETSFVSEKYRGTNTFKDLYFYTIEKAEDEQVELIWGFTALSKVWKKKLGFHIDDGIISETTLPLNRKNRIQAIVKSNQNIGTKSKQLIKSLFFEKSSKKQITNLRIHELDGSNREHMDLTQEIYRKWISNHSNYCVLDCNFDFMQWRVVNNPLCDYKVLAIYKNESSIGYAVINTTESTHVLVDCIVPEEKLLEEAIATIISYAIESTGAHLKFWGSNKNQYSNKIHATFKKHGAKSEINEHMNFVWRVGKHSKLDLVDASLFYINGLWTEGFHI